MNLFIPIPLMILTLAAIFARLSVDNKVISGCAVAVFLAICWMYSRLLRRREGGRVRRDEDEKIAMEQRYPFCHVTLLSSEEWFLTEKATGREYKGGARVGVTAPGTNEETR
ncbi:hypothetical protein [Burkholderia cenocepacia]|uniref:hypothetical protein n=1 Tax=Burkholderia cenocepacia TaxID=95486 RepID=UPI0022EA4363|nr:hypothetical protein [Burkholderia cenocepacia]MDA3669935.1 hypothetical protein [Burkholderia cenocepacia]MDA3679812.1 hypothetical protein [Burkholderia cenocepacia]MDA3687648.1 hypothetical protein [Burkholderia cenocepacia]MDA3694949.1 hypothetical protein [Burkholderia cenocepacia]MDA3701996.1 hypothetical protein [Burkholderia cenocepacia]